MGGSSDNEATQAVATLATQPNIDLQRVTGDRPAQPVRADAIDGFEVWEIVADKVTGDLFCVAGGHS